MENPRKMQAAIRLGGKLIVHALKKKGRIAVPYLGVFYISYRTSRIIHTDKSKSYVAVNFRPAERLKNDLNGRETR